MPGPSRKPARAPSRGPTACGASGRGGGGGVDHALRLAGQGKGRPARVLHPSEGWIRIPPPMARAPVEGPEQLFHFAEAAAPARVAPAFEPPRAVAEPVEVETVLITGIAGGQGRLIAHRIAGARGRIIGVDRTPWEGHPGNVRMHVVDIRK